MAEAVRMTLAEASVKLGVSVDALRRRLRKGEIRAERDNRGQWWVFVDPEATPTPKPSFDDRIAAVVAPAQDAAREAQAELVAELRGRIASLETDVERERAGREADRAAAATERDRLLCAVESLTRAASERPPSLIERLFGRSRR